MKNKDIEDFIAHDEFIEIIDNDLNILRSNSDLVKNFNEIIKLYPLKEE